MIIEDSFEKAVWQGLSEDERKELLDYEKYLIEEYGSGSDDKEKELTLTDVMTAKVFGG